jgi:PAS domain S-box-containing protein
MPRFDSARNLGIFLICGAFVGPFVSSFLDVAFVSWNGFGNQTYWTVWRMRFCSNVFTVMTLGSMIAIWGTRQSVRLRNAPVHRMLEAVAVWTCVLLVNIVVFCIIKSGPNTNPALLYAPLPFLLWAAVRFGLRFTSAALLSAALVAIWGAVHGRGPFSSHSPEQNAFSIQIFFGLISVTLLFLAASVTERRKAEERFTKAFRSNPDPMIISRLKDGHIIEVNDRWEELFGYRSAETLGETVYDLNIYLSQEDRDRLTAETARGQGSHDVELCLRTRSGDLRHVVVSADTEDIGHEHCLLVVLRDVTDRKRAEEAQQNLAHATRLAVVGELTAMMAHEVNQPLGAILSNADAAEILLQSANPPLDEIRQILSDIRENDLRADQAIRRIRTLLRKRETQMQELDINDIVSDVLQLTAGDALRRHVSTQKQFGTNLPLVLGDRVHLQQVLLNLIVNAMDAMDPIPQGRRLLTVATKKSSSSGVEVVVTDSGHGVAADKLPRLFESFFTTKRDGMGLGLSIARSIIEAHRGHICAEINPGGGMSFRFTVPTAKSVVEQNTAINGDQI